MDSKRLFKNWFLITLGVLISAQIFPGIHYESVNALVISVLMLGLLNIFLKPLLMLFALPFIIVSFGLGIWLINALLFLLVSRFVDGFYVDGFTYALAGALVVSLIDWGSGLIFGPSGTRGAKVRFEHRKSTYDAFGRSTRKPRHELDDDDVIDV